MFSERDLVSAVERQLLQVAETCRGVLVVRAESARPGRRPMLRDRLARPPLAKPDGAAAASSLAEQAARWRRDRRPGAPSSALPTTISPPSLRTPAASVGQSHASGETESESAPLALFLSPGKVVFLSVKPRRLSARPEESVTLSPQERKRHRQLRDCGFAVHIIAAETPADARDQVTALLKRLGLSVNG